MTTPELVYVHWKDAVTHEAAEPSTPVSTDLIDLRELGWLVGETSEAYCLAMELHQDGTAGRWRLNIPKVNVLEVKRVGFSKAFPKARKKKDKKEVPAS